MMVLKNGISGQDGFGYEMEVIGYRYPAFQADYIIL